MEEEACLLGTGDSQTGSSRIARLLGFFGVEHKAVNVEELSAETAKVTASSPTSRLFCSPGDLVQLVRSGQEPRRIHSIFVHSGHDTGSMTELLRAVTAEASDILLRETAGPPSAWEIADPADGFGGALRGLHVLPSERADPPWRVAEIAPGAGIPLLFAGRQAFFFRLQWKGIPIFVSLARKVIDIDAELTTPNFDLRDHLFTALPVVSYIRWAFPRTAWQAPETGACLIIDDPLLKPRYGFVRFRPLLTLMEQHNFSTSIAFIPWNWRRSARATVRLFKENPRRLSLSVHGCDHTAAEFGPDEVPKVRPRVQAAVARMRAHEKRTGFAHDHIMVFPQGVFSEAAMRELKRASFTAVVNTEVLSSGPGTRPIRICDVWDVAVRNYDSFPLYTRRYPRQGVENFAFDILLGKPCLVVIHHDFCRDNCQHLVEFIKRLNALRTPLAWRSLQDVVRRSYRERDLDCSSTDVEMYGGEILIQNRASNPRTFQVRKRETDAASISDVQTGGEPLPWDVDGGYLRFEVTLAAGGSCLVAVRRLDAETTSANGQLHSGLKTALRRYLSEFRDNYVVPARATLSRS